MESFAKCLPFSIKKEYPSYLQTIGQTPLVKLDRVLPQSAKHATVLAKLEMQNPGGSVKDRIALNMIEAAEATGALRPGMTVIEGTSGNTGIGLAMVCAAKGHGCVIIMPQVPSMMERYMICRQFGADVHLTAAGLGIKGVRAHPRPRPVKPSTTRTTNPWLGRRRSQRCRRCA